MRFLRLPGLVRQLAGLSIPALAVAALPKCPICVMAWLSAVGISIMPSNSTLIFASGLILCFPVVMLGMRVGGRRHPGPLLLGLCSAVLIVAGKLPGVPRPLALFGIAGLTAAFVWRTLNVSRLRPAAGSRQLVTISQVRDAERRSGSRAVAGRRSFSS